MNDYLPISQELKDEIDQNVNEKYQRHATKNGSCIQILTSLTEETSPKYDYLHYEYYQGYLELHFEGIFADVNSKLRKYLLEKSADRADLFTWHEWGRKANTRCRIYNGKKIQTQDELINNLFQMMDYFDPLISEFDPYEGVPKEFQQLIESFYGCSTGNINSPVWICGLEWGGGWSQDIPIPHNSLRAYSFEDIQCFSGEDFEENFWAPKSNFCHGALMALQAIKRTKFDGQYEIDFKVLEREKIVGPFGLGLILNAFPISFSGRTNAQNEWEKYKVRLSDGSVKTIEEWTSFKNIAEYQDYVSYARSKTYTLKRKELCPKVIICFGISNARQFKKLWGAKDSDHVVLPIEDEDKKSLPNNKCYWLSNGEGKSNTLLVITTFPGAIYGLKGSDQYDTLFKSIDSFLSTNLGSLWDDSMSWYRSDKGLPNLDENKHFLKLKAKRNATQNLIYYIDRLINHSNGQLSDLEEIVRLIENECLDSKQMNKMSEIEGQILTLYQELDDLRTHLDIKQKQSVREAILELKKTNIE